MGIAARNRAAAGASELSADSLGTGAIQGRPAGGAAAGVTRNRLELYYCQELARNAMRELSTSRTRGMPKALCMSGLVVAGLVIILFGADLAAPGSMAPFRKASILMDVALIASAVLLGLISWFTLREQ
jgi:hypothetical protein